MLLVEADGKTLFRKHGLSIPPGVAAAGSGLGATALPGDGPWVVKAQVPVGGRGKAGGVVLCRTRDEVEAALSRIVGSSIGGHVVGTCLIEAAVSGDEAYISAMVDAATGELRLTFVAEGGVDVEAAADDESGIHSIGCAPEAGAAKAALRKLLATQSPDIAMAIAAVGASLVDLLLEERLLLVEINPLFLTAAGPVAGDAKVVVDVNELERPTALRAMVEARKHVYADMWRKLEEGFDFIDVDPEGTIGLVTTGAGLSMMLIDELVARGGRPVNFCDIRTGQLRGKPDRLVRVLGWLVERRVRVVFVNIFAGITDLGEFAKLLDEALALVPELNAPIVLRLVGAGEEAARAELAVRRPDLVVHSDLDEALDRVVALIGP